VNFERRTAIPHFLARRLFIGDERGVATRTRVIALRGDVKFRGWQKKRRSREQNHPSAKQTKTCHEVEEASQRECKGFGFCSKRVLPVGFCIGRRRLFLFSDGFGCGGGGAAEGEIGGLPAALAGEPRDRCGGFGIMSALEDGDARLACNGASVLLGANSRPSVVEKILPARSPGDCRCRAAGADRSSARWLQSRR